jgi:hypothetical protein
MSYENDTRKALDAALKRAEEVEARWERVGGQIKALMQERDAERRAKEIEEKWRKEAVEDRDAALKRAEEAEHRWRVTTDVPQLIQERDAARAEAEELRDKLIVEQRARAATDSLAAQAARLRGAVDAIVHEYRPFQEMECDCGAPLDECPNDPPCGAAKAYRLYMDALAPGDGGGDREVCPACHGWERVARPERPWTGLWMPCPACQPAPTQAEGGKQYEQALRLVTKAIQARWPEAVVVSDKESGHMRIGDTGGRDLHICFLPAGSLHEAHIEAIRALESLPDSGLVVTLVHSIEATRKHFPHLASRKGCRACDSMDIGPPSAYGKYHNCGRHDWKTPTPENCECEFCQIGGQYSVSYKFAPACPNCKKELTRKTDEGLRYCPGCWDEQPTTASKPPEQEERPFARKREVARLQKEYDKTKR